MDCSLPGSSVHGILQARILEWVAISFQCLNVKSESEVAQSCPTLRDPMDCSLPGSSVHGILLARVLEWGVIAFSLDGGYSQAMELKLGLKGRGCQACHPGRKDPVRVGQPLSLAGPVCLRGRAPLEKALQACYLEDSESRS